MIKPRIPYLKKGNVIKFKVVVKGANYVTLLDGNHWSNLKKIDKDTFEGEKNIKTDNVSICCLKGKSKGCKGTCIKDYGHIGEHTCGEIHKCTANCDLNDLKGK